MATAKPKVVSITSAKTMPAAKTGTAVAVKKSGNVVSIMEALKAQAANVGERTAPASGITIRTTQDKKFVLPDGTRHDALQLVIVDFGSKYSFYEGAFDPKSITPPACFALGTNPLKMVPSKNSPLAQATDCQSCPNNLFGSDGNGKACKNSRVLAVLPPDADEDTPMWLLAVSPTALKGFDGFVAGVVRVFQTPPIGVVTTISFDENSTYAKLVFSDPQPNVNIESHFGRQEEAKKLLAIEPDVSSFVSAAKAPARKQAGRR